MLYEVITAITFLGLDMIKEPILISATAHYSMGGIPVDIDGHVRMNNKDLVEGFYAAGEASCSSVHGANRLGANSVLEALFFGRHVGQSILKDLDSLKLRPATASDADTMIKEIECVMGRNGSDTVPGLVITSYSIHYTKLYDSYRVSSV